MKNILFTVCMISVIATSCISTQITSSWSQPNKTVVLDNLHRVLVVAMFKTEVNRRRAEDQMIGYLNGKGVVSYNYLDANFNKQNEDAIRKKIKTDGFDAAVTMRLMNVDKENVYTPGITSTYPLGYRNFSGYYYRAWGFSETPRYYTTSKTYTVEVNVFSIKEEKIVWTGITQSIDPKGINKMTAEIVKVIYKKMKNDGFISK
jgi:hypothetical protein